MILPDHIVQRRWTKTISQRRIHTRAGFVQAFSFSAE